MLLARIVAAGLFSFVSYVALANDGGMAAIKASEIKMRQIEIKNGEAVETPVMDPQFKIYISGEEASKLQKILPHQVSVITGMQPELESAYNESFKALGIYNKTVSSHGQILTYPKVLTIVCNDADIAYDNGKYKINKKARTECVLTINRVGADDEIADYFGEMQTFNPRMCSR